MRIVKTSTRLIEKDKESAVIDGCKQFIAGLCLRKKKS